LFEIGALYIELINEFDDDDDDDDNNNNNNNTKFI